jgi:hypothetical protein
MITSAQVMKRYGLPVEERAMVVFAIPSSIEIVGVPHRIYCNRDLVEPLRQALTLVVQRGLSRKIKSWDGCFNIRQKRNGKGLSLHSWGLAVDINSRWNLMGQKSRQDPALVACFTESGFDWGGVWSPPDAMHFQLAKFPETKA